MGSDFRHYGQLCQRVRSMEFVASLQEREDQKQRESNIQERS